MSALKICHACGEKVENNVGICGYCNAVLVNNTPPAPRKSPPPPPIVSPKSAPPPPPPGAGTADTKTLKSIEQPTTQAQNRSGGKYFFIILLVLIVGAGAVISYVYRPNPDESSTGYSGSDVGQQETRQAELPAQTPFFTGNFTAPDGVYRGSAEGMSGLITVEVEFSGGQITKINVIEHNETPSYFVESYPLIAERIITEQQLNVDTQTGATMSARGIIAAVEAALIVAE